MNEPYDYSIHLEQAKRDEALLVEFKNKLRGFQDESRDLEDQLENAEGNDRLQIAGRIAIVLQEVRSLEENITVLETRMYSSSNAHNASQERLKHMPTKGKVQ